MSVELVEETKTHYTIKVPKCDPYTKKWTVVATTSGFKSAGGVEINATICKRS